MYCWERYDVVELSLMWCGRKWVITVDDKGYDQT